MKAMEAKIEVIERNDTQELVYFLQKQRITGIKWALKIKLEEKGGIDKYKEQIVAKGYKYEYVIYYVDVFALLESHEIITMLIALAK